MSAQIHLATTEDAERVLSMVARFHEEFALDLSDEHRARGDERRLVDRWGVDAGQRTDMGGGVDGHGAHTSERTTGDRASARSSEGCSLLHIAPPNLRAVVISATFVEADA